MKDNSRYQIKAARHYPTYRQPFKAISQRYRRRNKSEYYNITISMMTGEHYSFNLLCISYVAEFIDHLMCITGATTFSLFLEGNENELCVSPYNNTCDVRLNSMFNTKKHQSVFLLPLNDVRTTRIPPNEPFYPTKQEFAYEKEYTRRHNVVYNKLRAVHYNRYKSVVYDDMSYNDYLLYSQTHCLLDNAYLLNYNHGYDDNYDIHDYYDMDEFYEEDHHTEDDYQ